MNHAIVAAKAKEIDQAVANSPPLAIDMQTCRMVLKKPLLSLPAVLRPAMLQVWLTHKYLPGMESAVPMSCALAVWISEHGLLVEDALTILQGLVAPSAMRQHMFASQIMTELAAEADKYIKHRANLAEQQRRRDEAAATPPTPPEAQQMLQDLKEAFGVKVEGGA